VTYLSTLDVRGAAFPIHGHIEHDFQPRQHLIGSPGGHVTRAEVVNNFQLLLVVLGVQQSDTGVGWQLCTNKQGDILRYLF